MRCEPALHSCPLRRIMQRRSRAWSLLIAHDHGFGARAARLDKPAAARPRKSDCYGAVWVPLETAMEPLPVAGSVVTGDPGAAVGTPFATLKTYSFVAL